MLKIMDDGQVNIHRRAVETWGECSVIDKTVEELSELIHALQKLKYKTSKKRVRGVLEELADVTICMKNIMEMEYFDETEFSMHLQARTLRMEDRLNDPNYKQKIEVSENNTGSKPELLVLPVL